MSYSNISDVLLEFNKDGSNQKSALALSNTSELEIKNLLKQVDTMIHHKKLRWERQKQELDNKLHMKEQEFESQKTALDQKNVEVDSLKKLLENMETSTKEIMKKYENEINILHEQLNKLKTDYIKIQKKYKKCSKKSSSEPETPYMHMRDSSRDNNIREKVTSQQHFNPPTESKLFKINSSTSSTSTLSSFTHRTPDSHHKLPISNKAAQIKNRDHSHGPTSQFDHLRLNTKLEENKLKNIEFYQEREKLNKSLEHYKRMNKELIKKIDELTLAKEENEANYIDKASQFNVEHYKQEIRKRDDYIRDMEALDKADNIELQFYKDEVKKLKKQEINYKNQIEKIKFDYEDTVKRLQNMENENKKLKNKIQTYEEKAKNDEILINNYEREKECLKQEVANLKNELLVYSSEMNEKNNQIKNLTDRSNRFEQQLKEKDEQISKTNQELMMTVAHVEALRLENHFLRQSLDEKKSDEKEIVEMQKKYHHVIDLTEKENKRLKNEIVSLSECVESLKSKVSTPSKMSFNKNNSDFENRKAKLQKEDFDKQIESLRKQHELSIKRLNNEIEKLYSEKHSLIAELESNRHHNFNNHLHFLNHDKYNLTKPNRSNASSTLDSLSVGALSVSNHTTTMNNPINTISEEMMRKNRQFKGTETVNNYRLEEQSLTRNISSNTSNARFNTDFEPIEHSPAKSSRFSIASQLRYDEQKRKKDLENMLDIHIDSLKRSNANDNNNFI